MEEIKYKFIIETLKEIRPCFYACMLIGRYNSLSRNDRLRDCNHNEFSVFYTEKPNEKTIKYTCLVVSGKAIPCGDYFIKI